MDKRDKAIEDIKAQIRARRGDIDTETLDKLRLLAEHLYGVSSDPATVPYDKMAAKKVIETFLEGHPDAKAFQARFLKFLQKQSH